MDLSTSPNTAERLRCLGGHSVEMSNIVPSSPTDFPQTPCTEEDARLALFSGELPYPEFPGKVSSR